MIFESVAQDWLASLTNKSTPVRPATIKNYRSVVQKHLLPRFGNMPLEQLAASNNRVLRDLVRDLRASYAPASITLICQVAKQIIESPKNENGLPLFDVKWANDFIDLPAVVNQKQPTVTAEQVQAACADRKDGQLYLLLAASGLRISEALALRKEAFVDGAVQIREGKTPNAARIVDLASPISAMMDKLAGETKPGERIFRSHLTTLRERQKVPGFHSLRRFRESVLQRSACRDLLIDYWMGHANREMGTRYAKQLLEDGGYRREQCERAGLGFTLSEHLYHGSAAQSIQRDNLAVEIL